MANINIEALKKNTFDTIVIGSGMSGGWAAKEFCEKGLKTLVLERGRDVKHVTDYPTAMKNPWEFDHRGSCLWRLKTNIRRTVGHRFCVKKSNIGH